VDGILSVTAKELESGKEQSVTIKDTSNLSKSEVESMVEDAKKNAAADEEKKEKFETVEKGIQLVTQVKKVFEELDADESQTNPFGPEVRTEIFEKLDLLEAATEAKDYDKIKELTPQIEALLNQK
jgi:molecular chaperone DnaK